MELKDVSLVFDCLKHWETSLPITQQKSLLPMDRHGSLFE